MRLYRVLTMFRSTRTCISPAIILTLSFTVIVLYLSAERVGFGPHRTHSSKRRTWHVRKNLHTDDIHVGLHSNRVRSELHDALQKKNGGDNEFGKNQSVGPSTKFRSMAHD